MTAEQAINILRTIINFPVVKLTLPSQDIALAEEAIRTLADKPAQAATQ